MARPPRFDPLHKNRLKPTKSRTINPTAEFAYQADMITDEEYEACRIGNMTIEHSNMLSNWNHQHPTLLSGQSTKIFIGRATQINIARLLGLDE